MLQVEWLHHVWVRYLVGATRLLRIAIMVYAEGHFLVQTAMSTGCRYGVLGLTTAGGSDPRTPFCVERGSYAAP